jgi:hypothetical protein
MPSTNLAAASAVITDARANATAVASVTNGGFDPVSVLAAAGDTIVVELVDSSGATSRLLGSVRPVAPPRVVRTSPVHGRTDVPLNVRVTVVFSAPIARASAEDNIRLRTSSGDTVPGRFEPVGLDSVAFEFKPAAGQLSPATTYRLEVGPAVRDVVGQRLGVAATAEFVTVTSAPSSEPPPPSATVQQIKLWSTVYFRPVFAGDRVTVDALAYDSRGASIPADFTFEIPDLGLLQLVSQDRTSMVVQAVAPGRALVIGRAAGLVDTAYLLVASNVSPAEFASRRLLFSEGGQLVTMNGDGSNRVVLPTPTVAYHPSLGPDSRIIYSSGLFQAGQGSLFIREPDGTTVRFGESDGESCPRWSPDGSRVVSARVATAELVVRRRDGTVERIVPEAGGCANWTPDGLRLFTGEDQVTPTQRYWWAGLTGPVAPDARRMLIPLAWRIAEVDALADRPYPPMVEWWLGFQSAVGQSASWSPDGEALAIAVWTSAATEELWMVSGDGVRRAAVPGVGHVDGVQVVR